LRAGNMENEVKLPNKLYAILPDEKTNRRYSKA
jgi:hypothetical protein